ncbi:MAG: YqeG family HAD IIIA-type phosphatase [Clostridia bacterium]|nr:YqeG family HAD IIIA-type phosphatase [Clostridia bacterium]
MHLRKDTTIKYMFRSVNDITPEIVRELGLEAILFDLDNTTVKDATLTTIPGAISWVKSLKEAGIQVAIVTNTPSIRAYWFSKAFGVRFHGLARKPLSLGLIRMSRKLKVPIEKIGMVGDQVFTDVAAANRCGAVPILVDPVENKWFWKNHYKKNRLKEKPIRDKFLEEHGYYGDK